METTHNLALLPWDKQHQPPVFITNRQFLPDSGQRTDGVTILDAGLSSATRFPQVWSVT